MPQQRDGSGGMVNELSIAGPGNGAQPQAVDADDPDPGTLRQVGTGHLPKGVVDLDLAAAIDNGLVQHVRPANGVVDPLVEVGAVAVDGLAALQPGATGNHEDGREH